MTLVCRAPPRCKFLRVSRAISRALFTPECCARSHRYYYIISQTNKKPAVVLVSIKNKETQYFWVYMIALLLLFMILSGCEGSLPWAWIKALNEIVMDEPREDPVRGQTLPVQLLPWLWLSDQASVELNMRDLHCFGITHVLSTNAMETHELEHLRSEAERLGMQYYAVNGHDEDGYKNEGGYNMIGNHWDECRAFLQKVQESGGKVVIHCAAGKNRSGLIACAAIMVFERRSVLDVVKLAKKKRFTLLTNRSFQRQLCVLAAREGLLGPKPIGFTDDPPVCRDAIDFSKLK